jgi:DNA-binding NtrC family response regulator
LSGGNLGDFCGTPVPNFPERARLLNDIVELPFRSWLASVKVSTTASGRAVMGKSKPKHILLVEDYDPVRELIANMLEDRGYRVSTVSAGASMRDFLRTDDRVDAIVLNAATPGEKGASLARHAKDLGLPVVMISGSSDEISFAAQHGLQLLRKPFQAEELYGALDRALFSGEFGQRSA